MDGVVILSKLKILAKGIGWGSVSVTIITVLQIALMAIMARLLAPADFGLVAIANICLRFFNYFAQMGITPAIIQKKNIDDGDLQAALFISIGVSSICSIVVIISSGLIEDFFKIQNVGLVIQILSMNFVIGGFSSISIGLLRRNNEFKKMALIEIASYVVGYGFIGLISANAGAGVWALVAAFITQMSLLALLSYNVTRYTIGFRHTKKQREYFLSYGGRYSIIGFIEFLSSNIDAIVIGRLMGATPAGFYNRALLLANLPIQQPANILTKALFPIMSSIGNQHDKQSLSVQLGILLVGCYAFAIGTGLYVAAPIIVTVLLGDAWSESIPVLRILAWSVGPIYISHVISVTLDSMNCLNVKLKVQLMSLMLMVILLAGASQTNSISYIALALTVSEWGRLLAMMFLIVRLLNIEIKELLRIFLSILITSIVCGLLIFVTFEFIPFQWISVFGLLVQGLIGVFGFVVGIFISRVFLSKISAILFLRSRLPIVERFFCFKY